MTGAETVLNWMNKYYQEWGTPNFGEIQAQLEMAIEEEKRENKSDSIDLVNECQHNYVVFNGCFRRCTKCNKVINENHPDFR